MQHDVAVAPFGRSARLGGRAGKAVRLAGAVAVAGVVSLNMAERRGPVVGLLAFLTYGLLLGSVALSMSRVRRWSADHVVLDAALVVPLSFLALLLIPVLPWWVTALAAAATGAVFVPFAVRRRAAHRVRAAQQADG